MKRCQNPITFRTHLDHGLKLYGPKKTVLCYDIDGSWNFHNPWPSAVDSIGDVPMRSAKVCSSRTKNNICELCKMKLELHSAIQAQRLHIGIILNKSNILSRFSQGAFSLIALKWGGGDPDRNFSIPESNTVEESLKAA